MQHTQSHITARLITALALLVCSPSYAQIGSSYQLSGEMGEFGDALEIKISPDSRYVVYLADQDTNAINELYSVPTGGGTPIRLNGNLVAGGDVDEDFQISADSKWVIYPADQDVDGVVELYSVSITGGIPQQLNVDPTSAALDGVTDFLISADSQHVVYRSDETFNDHYFIYSVPINGGMQTLLNPFMNNGRYVMSDFLISADSQYVIYRADRFTDGINELFSVEIGGGNSDKLNADLVVDGFVLEFIISPDSQRVIYRAIQDEAGVLELFSVAIEDGNPEQLHPTLDDGGDIMDFAISADSQWVVYRADQDTDTINELYSVPILGGSSTRLNANLESGGNVFASAGAPSFQISQDSQRVVYRADQDIDNVFELYSVDIGGGTPQQLNSELTGGSDVDSAFKISNDSQRVAYIANPEHDDVLSLYSSPIVGGSQVKLSTNTIANNGEVRDNFQITSDNKRVVFLADDDFDELFKLFSVPIAGATPEQVNGDLVVDGSVNADRGGFLLSADAGFVIYLADQDELEQEEVFARRLKAEDGLCIPIKSNTGAVVLICL